MRARIVLLLIGLTALWSMMIARAAFLQLWPNERLKSLQKRQFETVVTLNARRGDVVDRNGHELAVSMTMYSLFADPKIIEQPRAVARQLARELHLPVKSIDEHLRNHKKRFVWLARQLPKSTRDSIADMKVRGLGFIEESQRIYPNDRLLANVLGFVGEDGQGLEGLEQKFNENLQANAKKFAVRRDAHGRPLIVNGQIFNQVPDGAEVQLTIDRELQFILEEELNGAVREHDADSAVGVVLDAQTSEVLAMASAPAFDPNHPQDFSPERRRNRAITDSFEPGSVMKTLLIAGALKNGLIEPNSKFDCQGGVMKIGKRVIREADGAHKFGVLTVSEILAYSSNVGASKIAFKMGEDNVRDTLKLFGFGDKSGIDLPGEAKGIMQPGPWAEHLLANVSFGHGVTVTALQMANAYASIANGGYLKQPYVVKSIRDHESGEVTDSQPKTIRHVLNSEQVAKMRIMLAGVTSDHGTGVRARVPGYPVAGKTGTAQKVNPNGRGYLKGGYISSFAGFLPANDPRFVIYVAVDRPRKGYYGADVAAPVFSRVAKFAVRHAGLAPVLISEQNVVPLARREPARAPILPLTPIEELAASDLTTSMHSESEIEAAHQPEVLVAGQVPDFSGLSLREVLARLSGSGISVKVHGQGFVNRTSPPAMARLSENKELGIYLEQ